MQARSDKVFRRAEFWEGEECTLLEIVNVLGRWEVAEEWAERTEFSVVQDTRVENMAQGATKERYEMARRNGLVERLALIQNAPKMPFTNAPLAAAYGKQVADFQAMPVSKASVNVVFDTLAESKSSLLAQGVCNERRARLITEANEINQLALAYGLYKARVLVMFSWLFFGKGQLYGVLVGGKVVLDSTGFFEQLPPEIAPYAEPVFFLACLLAAVYAYQSAASIAERTSDFETFSEEVMPEQEQYVGVLERWNKALNNAQNKLLGKVGDNSKAGASEAGVGLDAKDWRIVLFLGFFLGGTLLTSGSSGT